MKNLKEILGNVPYSAELYWLIRQKGSPTTAEMDLRYLAKVLPEWTEAVRKITPRVEQPKKILVFGVFHRWISYASLIALTLSAEGHDVTLAFSPYAHRCKTENLFDVRRQNAYILESLKPAAEFIKIASLFNSGSANSPGLDEESLRTQAYYDTQYCLSVEEVEVGSELYNRRLERARAMAQASFAYLAQEKPDVVITPNGSIFEFGILFKVAKKLGIPTSTFEFGEQNYRMWLAQNDDVMRQNTETLWKTRGSVPLTEAEWTTVRKMFEARQGAKVWETFARQWQIADSKGGEKIRTELGLDDRPLMLLPTNVLGDSLTLGRQIFASMTEWMRRTIRWFEEHPQYQLVIRIHPGEQISWGPSAYDILKKDFPEFPENVLVLPGDYKINSYDLVEAADAGMVFTTTLGMEVAMLGKPIIVLGETHYRRKGFTIDPRDWDEYFDWLGRVMQSPAQYRLSEEKVNAAWTYAYRFFFEYPLAFPWHLQHLDDCLKEWPIERVLSEEGRREFGRTFDYLIGEKPLFSA